MTLAVGAPCRSAAQAPATCGAAMDVPLNASKLPPGTDETIESPGARSERNDATFEKEEIWSLRSVEPTLTTEEMQAGDEMLVFVPLLPDATTVATPMDRRLSMIGL